MNGLEGIGASWIIDELIRDGFTAYAVGGCVRDMMMNKYLGYKILVHDIDICTSASPMEVKKLFKDNYELSTIDTGLKHGTESVVISSKMFSKLCKSSESIKELEKIRKSEGPKHRVYEITTYRIDGKYSDGRHPDDVQFTRSIEQDLMRRDFTINAMAYSNGELVSIDTSFEDLKHKIIRCVGNADDRLSEDPLRILRAFRFQATLGFEIEDETYKAMKRNCEKLSSISKERIQAEFIKAFSGKYIVKALKNNLEIIEFVIPQVREMVQCCQNNPHHFGTVWEHTLKVIQNIVDSLGDSLKDDRNFRLTMAGLLHDIGKPAVKEKGKDGFEHFNGHAKVSEEVTYKLLKDLKFSNDDILNIRTLVRLHDLNFPNKKSVKRVIANIGFKQFKNLSILREADIEAQSEFHKSDKLASLVRSVIWADEIEKENEAVKVSDLAVNGRDLMKLGFKAGPILGVILNNMLELVIDDKIQNTYEDLIDYAKSELNKIQ